MVYSYAYGRTHSHSYSRFCFYGRCRSYVLCTSQGLMRHVEGSLHAVAGTGSVIWYMSANSCRVGGGPQDTAIPTRGRSRFPQIGLEGQANTVLCPIPHLPSSAVSISKTWMASHIRDFLSPMHLVLIIPRCTYLSRGGYAALVLRSGLLSYYPATACGYM